MRGEREIRDGGGCVRGESRICDRGGGCVRGESRIRDGGECVRGGGVREYS